MSRSWIDENEGEKYNYMNLDLRRTVNKANSKRRKEFNMTVT